MLWLLYLKLNTRTKIALLLQLRFVKLMINWGLAAKGKIGLRVIAVLALHATSTAPFAMIMKFLGALRTSYNLHSMNSFKMMFVSPNFRLFFGYLCKPVFGSGRVPLEIQILPIVSDPMQSLNR